MGDKKVGWEFAKDLHTEYENAIKDKKKRPFYKQDDPNKVKLWDTMNKILSAYRNNPNKSASNLYEKLGVQYNEGDSQEKVLFDQSNMTLEDYMNVAISNPDDFAEFGRLVVSYRSQTELTAKKLVAYMKFGEDAVSETDDGEREVEWTGAVRSALVAENEFIQDLSALPYVKQVEVLAILMKWMSETNSGKWFLASQFSHRDWNNDKDVSNLVFDPYKLFYPPKVDEKPPQAGADEDPSDEAHFGIGILKSDSTGGENRPTREDLFDKNTGHLKGPDNVESEFRSQAKSLRENFEKLFTYITPGVTFFDKQSGGSDSVFSPPYPLGGGNDTASKNVQRWQGLMWAKYFKHDTSSLSRENRIKEINNHSDELGKLATGKPSNVNEFPDWAEVSTAIVTGGVGTVDKFFAETVGRPQGLGLIKLCLVMNSFYTICSGAVNQDSLDTSDYADILIDLTKFAGDLSVSEDIADNFLRAVEGGSEASKMAKAFETAGRVGPFIDAYYMISDTQQAYQELREDDVDAAVGMSMSAAGGGMMLAGSVAASGGAAAAVGALTPAGWVIIAGGAIATTGAVIHQIYDDTDLENLFSQTYFGVNWDPENKDYRDPALRRFRFVDDEGDPNFARQISELMTLSRDLNPEAQMTSRGETGHDSETTLRLVMNPGKIYSNEDNPILADGVVFVRPIVPDDGDYEIRDVLHKLKLTEVFHYDPDTDTIEANPVDPETEIPMRNTVSLDYDTDNDIIRKANAAKTHVIKGYKVLINEDDEKAYWIARGDAGDVRLAANSREIPYYLELVYIPGQMYKRLKETDFLDTAGQYNDLDSLEDLPFVARKRVPISFDDRFNTNWYDL